jgi:hypothetical protein
MEGYCSTGQSPQRAVVPMEEEEYQRVDHAFIWKVYLESMVAERVR